MRAAKHTQLGIALAIPASVGILAMAVNAVLPTQLQDVSDTRAALEQHIEIQKIISDEKRDWAIGKELLKERVAVIQQDIAALREKESEAQASITEADKTRIEMTERRDQLVEATSSLEGTIADLEVRTIALLERVPVPLREHVKPLSQQIPEDSGQTELRIATRFGNISGILQEVNKFNNEISVHSETLDHEDGESISVTTLYVGIAHGYYVNSSGSIAGVGRGTAEGWTWTEANEAAVKIAEAVAIVRNEKPASFVQLPVTIE